MYLGYLVLESRRTYSESMIRDALSKILEIIENLGTFKEDSYVKIWKYKGKIDGTASENFIKEFFSMTDTMLDKKWDSAEIRITNNTLEFILEYNGRKSMFKIGRNYVKFYWDIGYLSPSVTFEKIKEFLENMGISFEVGGKSPRVKCFLFSIYITYRYLQSTTSNSFNKNSI